MRSGENALFSFSPNLGVDRHDPFTKLGGHRTQGDKTPTSEEQPHDENYLEEILQLRGLRSPISDEPIYPGSETYALLAKLKKHKQQGL